MGPGVKPPIVHQQNKKNLVTSQLNFHYRADFEPVFKMASSAAEGST